MVRGRWSEAPIHAMVAAFTANGDNTKAVPTAKMDWEFARMLGGNGTEASCKIAQIESRQFSGLFKFLRFLIWRSLLAQNVLMIENEGIGVETSARHYPRGCLNQNCFTLIARSSNPYTILL